MPWGGYIWHWWVCSLWYSASEHLFLVSITWFSSREYSLTHNPLGAPLPRAGYKICSYLTYPSHSSHWPSDRCRNGLKGNARILVVRTKLQVCACVCETSLCSATRWHSAEKQALCVHTMGLNPSSPPQPATGESVFLSRPHSDPQALPVFWTCYGTERVNICKA